MELGVVFAQITVHLICVCPIHLTFGEHGEGGTVAFACEFFNLRVSAGFLTSKLVTGEGKDLETLLSILLVQVG